MPTPDSNRSDATRSTSRPEASEASTLPPRRVAVLAADRVRAAGLRAMLSEASWLDVVGDTGGSAGTRETVRAGNVDVLVADVAGDGHDADLSGAIHETPSTVAVVVLTDETAHPAVNDYLANGVRGLLGRDCASQLLQLAVAAAAEGGILIDPAFAPFLVQQSTGCCMGKGGPLGLSKRQCDVLRLLPAGLTNKEIATRLGITEETVKTHLQNAMRKLKVSSRSEAATVALREGLDPQQS